MRTSSQINEEDSNDNCDDDFDQNELIKTISSTDKVAFSVHRSSTRPSSELNDEDDVSKNILMVSATTWFPIHTLIIMAAYD